MWYPQRINKGIVSLQRVVNNNKFSRLHHKNCIQVYTQVWKIAMKESARTKLIKCHVKLKGNLKILKEALRL